MFFIIHYTNQPNIVTDEQGNVLYFDTLPQAVEYGRANLQKNTWTPQQWHLQKQSA